MKKIFLTLAIFLTGLYANAQGNNILVLPLFMTNSQNYNFYGFETTSEIIANDIINNFNFGHHIKSSSMDAVREAFANDNTLASIAQTYLNSNLIDFGKLTSLAQKLPSDKTLLITSYVEDKSGTKLDTWDVLKFATDFDIDYPYTLTTKVLLIDNTDSIVLWQRAYSTPLTSDMQNFTANSDTKAIEQFEKIHSFSKNIISKDVEEGLILRLNPKSIDFASQTKKDENTREGIGLKFYKNMPSTTKITQPKETFEQQLLNDDTFSL